MGSHNFLDRSGFTALRVISEDLMTGAEELGTGFIVHASNARHTKEGNIFLVGNHRVLWGGESKVINLEFFEQDPDSHNVGIPKKSCVELRHLRDKIVQHPDETVDLVCIDISHYVTDKFIKGVNPFFCFDENLQKKTKIPSSLCYKAHFYTTFLPSHSQGRLPIPIIDSFSYRSPVTEYGVDLDAVRGTKQGFPLCDGSPLLSVHQGKPHFNGFSSHRSAVKNTASKEVATTVGATTVEATEVRELIQLIQNGQKRKFFKNSSGNVNPFNSLFFGQNQ